MRAWPLRWVIPSIALVLVLLTELVIGATVLGLLGRTLREQTDKRLEDAAAELLAHPGDLRDNLGRGRARTTMSTRSGRAATSSSPSTAKTANSSLALHATSTTAGQCPTSM